MVGRRAAAWREESLEIGEQAAHLGGHFCHKGFGAPQRRCNPLHRIDWQLRFSGETGPAAG
jgi:hypothetical protein